VCLWEIITSDKTSTQWLDALKKPSLPIVLTLLAGLIPGHKPTQEYVFVIALKKIAQK
jgi:hypothetical protein